MKVKCYLTLSTGLQWRVLEFTRGLGLSVIRGVPGHRLVTFAGAISLDDVEWMSRAIEQGSEQVDVNEW